MLLFKKKKKQQPKPTFKDVLTALLATQAAIFLLLLAGLSLAGTAVAFIATMPIFVVFSPVLVPASITTGLLATGLAASGGSGVTALTIIMWLYKQLTGMDPPKIPGLTPAASAPADKPADKPAEPKPADKPAAKPPAKPAAKPATKPEAAPSK